MLPIISAALAIADAAGLDDWVINKLTGGDSGAAKIATSVIDMAKGVTGITDPVAVAETIRKDSEAAYKMRMVVAENEHDLKMAVYHDRKDARAMYVVDNQQADKIADNIIKWNPLFITVALIANCGAVYLLQDEGAILAAISSVLGMAIKSLFDERLSVTGFYFGSSMGSKIKDKNNVGQK